MLPPCTTTGEAPFTFEELFFSRTDTRGMIQSGNSVFQRISMYAWEELLKKPHNVIRHADMPKGVFWLFWDRLKKGEPIGAYVKNKTKDGRYYWVFAIATPVDGGFLSVRLKPSSDLLHVIEREYAALITREREGNLSPKESADYLLQRLAAHGFADYGEFMAQALSKEIRARDHALGRVPDRTIAWFDETMDEAKALLQHAQHIFAAYEANTYVPLNLQVQSTQLGEQGASIGVIFKDYSILSDEIKTMMDQFMRSSQQVFATIHHGLFLAATTKVQREVIAYFEREAADNFINRQQEMAYLEAQRHAYGQKVEAAVNSIIVSARQFQQDCDSMKRLAMGLEVTRVMGKVESARLTIAKDGLNELIHELELFQTAISSNLKEIEKNNRSIRQTMEAMLGTTTLAA